MRSLWVSFELDYLHMALCSLHLLSCDLWIEPERAQFNLISYHSAQVHQLWYRVDAQIVRLGIGQALLALGC